MIEKELRLAEQLKLYGIDIEGVIKRAYDSLYSKIVSTKTDTFYKSDLICETFTHYIPQVVSKRKFYRLAILKNGKIEVEYFGTNAKNMNDCYLKLKEHCKNEQ